MSQKIMHPVQSKKNGEQSLLTSEITLMAYEVYCHVYSPQEAIVSGNCRGGFSTGELIAYLYARNFLREEWKARVRLAFDGMENL